MSNKHRVSGASQRRERVVTPALQLGFAVEVKQDPQGTEWVGMTFGQGTLSFTLAVPVADASAFCDMVTQTVTDSIRQHREKTGGLVVPRTDGIILPGQS